MGRVYEVGMDVMTDLKEYIINEEVYAHRNIS